MNPPYPPHIFEETVIDHLKEFWFVCGYVFDFWFTFMKLCVELVKV